MISITEQQQRFASYTTDVLVFIVVLNLFVEYSESVVIDSFSISIMTAVVLKVLLDLVVAAEHRVSAFFARRDRPLSKLFRVLSLWLVLFGSKFVILEVIDVVFGQHVELGGFLLVVALIVAMMVARQVFARMNDALGSRAEASI
jgi:hypothetical protein